MYCRKKRKLPQHLLNENISGHKMSSQEPLLSCAYHTVLVSVEIEEFSFTDLVSCDYLWLLGQRLCAHHLPYA